METILFQESQSFCQFWMMAIVLITTVLVVGLLINNLRQKKTYSRLIALYGGSIVCLFVLALLIFSRLDVRISPNELETRFFPLEFSYKKISWKEVESFQLVKINPVNYGGLGLRLVPNTKAYVISDGNGLSFQLKSGYKLVVSSRKVDEFAEVVKPLINME